MKLLLLLFLVSCAGYHFDRTTNPFKHYNIKSVAVPMFINHSSIPHTSALFTKEVFALLSKYRDLKVVSGNNMKQDAILLGVISGPERRKDLFKVDSKIFTDGAVRDSLGQRKPLYLPQSVKYQLQLRLILLKNPHKKELDLLSSPMGALVPKNERIIFNEQISFEQSYSRKIFDNLKPDSGGVVNFTNSFGNFEKSLEELAVEASRRIEQEIFNAF